MLKRLSVQNFALIDDLEIEFDKGLIALTGETGSGKSILLESLSLLFGKRSDVEFIRHGKNKAIVIGEFELGLDQQKQLELQPSILLTREIDESGRHLVKLNNEVITLAKLRQISQAIGLIHGQNDTFLLLDKSSYVSFIDQMDYLKVQKIHETYLLKRNQYLERKNHFESLKSKRLESLERKDFLAFQVKELESLNLKADEKEKLEDTIEKLKNFDQIKQALDEAHQQINSQTFNLDNLYIAYKNMQRVSSYDESYEKLSLTLEDIYYTLEEATRELGSLLKNLDFDEDTYHGYQARAFELGKIEQKYGKPVNELISYLASIKEELALSSDYDGYLEKVSKEVDTLYQAAFDQGMKLHEQRKLLAEKLAKELTKSVRELDLEKCEFKIEFEKIEDGMSLDEVGLDKVELMISLNEGEPLKPLSKVASGGEKARFMFSLKSLFARNSGLSLLVFDEIDIGISGKTASKVATKMKELSTSIQILVITHLPQVAAKANEHFNIYKEKVDGRMQTFIKKLSQDDRILSIAGMLSDDSISTYAIEQAKALLSK